MTFVLTPKPMAFPPLTLVAKSSLPPIAISPFLTAFTPQPIAIGPLPWSRDVLFLSPAVPPAMAIAPLGSVLTNVSRFPAIAAA